MSKFKIGDKVRATRVLSENLSIEDEFAIETILENGDIQHKLMTYSKDELELIEKPKNIRGKRSEIICFDEYSGDSNE